MKPMSELICPASAEPSLGTPGVKHPCPVCTRLVTVTPNGKTRTHLRKHA